MYDYAGVLGFVIDIEENKYKWFCSEIVTMTLLCIDVVEGLVPSKTSPNRLYDYLKGKYNAK
jgi:hypothetical protein